MDTDSAPPLPRRWRFGPITMVFLGGGGLLLILVLAIVIAGLRSSQALDAELDRIRAAGEPASAEELEAFYKAPPADIDTTQLWIAALAPLDTPEFKAAAKDLPFVGELQDPIPLPGEPWPQLEAAEQLLADYREPLKLIHGAAQKGGQARFPTDFSNRSTMVMLPHCQQLKAGTLLLQLEAAVAAHRGNADAAVDAIIATAALARSLDREPVLVSQLVRIAICGNAVARVQWLLSAMTIDERQLARLDAEWATLDCQRTLRLGLLGERVMVMGAFANPDILGDGAQLVRAGIMPTADQAAFLNIFAQFVAASNKTGEARKKLLDDANARIDQLRNSTLATLRYPVTNIMTRGLDACFESANRNELQRDMARLAVAVERFHLRHGRLPRNLDELMPTFMDALPIDPFDGAPLRYRIDATEYLIYSVGADGIDQGGLAEPPGQPVDLIFRVRRKDSDRQPQSTTVNPQP